VEATTAWIKAEAAKEGFEACGICLIPEVWAASDRLRDFVETGLHGQMGWMETTLERRVHPKAMWPEAKSAVVVALNYGPETDPLESLQHTDKASISVYARGDDYHEIIKKKLKSLGGRMANGLKCELKVFVDTAPLMEKPLAALAGIGWQGKHTNLVSRDLGSWFFLGVILTNLELSPDLPEPDHCGSCQACLDICPTKAFLGPYRLDARACLSYLTIEHKGAWPEQYRAAMGNRIYGCDDCLAACPWNKFAKEGQELKLQARESLRDLPLVDLAQLDDQAFRALFTKSAIKRIGLGAFLRNVQYAIGNDLRQKPFTEFHSSGNNNALSVLQTNLSHDLAVVRGSAVWALKQGLEAQAFEDLRAQYSTLESDADVLSEWHAL
jgi:epoxyqueuosine reductase